MLKTFVYPAIVEYDKESGYYVRFPDFENCFTDGDDIIEALINAEDVLNLSISSMQKNNKLLPLPTNIFSLNKDIKENEFVTMVKTNIELNNHENIDIDKFIDFIKKYSFDDSLSLIDFEKYLKIRSE